MYKCPQLQRNKKFQIKRLFQCFIKNILIQKCYINLNIQPPIYYKTSYSFYKTIIFPFLYFWIITCIFPLETMADISSNASQNVYVEINCLSYLTQCPTSFSEHRKVSHTPYMNTYTDRFATYTKILDGPQSSRHEEEKV